jgi:hypothetical protein
MALDERRDVRVVRSGEKVSFPVAWHGAILGSAGRLRIETVSTICPSPLFVVPPLAWRICRAVRRCAISSFFSTPRV